MEPQSEHQIRYRSIPPPHGLTRFVTPYKQRNPMANLARLPDEIVQYILQSIYDNVTKSVWDRDTDFLCVVKVLPRWIPMLLDMRFLNDAGQLTTRYEEIWGYRHRVYLDERSGLWGVRHSKWQPRGAKISGWKCRNGESSHVDVQEQEAESLESPRVAENTERELTKKRLRKAKRKEWWLNDLDR